MHSSQFGITFTDSRGPVNSDGPIHCIRSLNRMVRYSVMPVCGKRYTMQLSSAQSPHSTYPFMLHDRFSLPWNYAIWNGVFDPLFLCVDETVLTIASRNSHFVVQTLLRAHQHNKQFIFIVLPIIHRPIIASASFKHIH